MRSSLREDVIGNDNKNINGNENGNGLDGDSPMPFQHKSPPRKGRQSKRKVQEHEEENSRNVASEKKVDFSAAADATGEAASTRRTRRRPSPVKTVRETRQMTAEDNSANSPKRATRSSTRKRDSSPPLVDEQPLVVEKKRKKPRTSKTKAGTGTAQEADKENRFRFQSPPPPTPDIQEQPHQQQGGTTSKITLPAADTPVMQRNKKMRQAGKTGKAGQGRRSSLGMRGRRASSLIDSGASNGEWRSPLLYMYESLY